MPNTRNEQEIAGYRDVLSTIHKSHDFIPPKSSIILQLHRDLYKFSGKPIGGVYKNSDNIIYRNRFVRFQPVPAWKTPAAVEVMCGAFEDAITRRFLIRCSFSIFFVFIRSMTATVE